MQKKDITNFNTFFESSYDELIQSTKRKFKGVDAGDLVHAAYVAILKRNNFEFRSARATERFVTKKIAWVFQDSLKTRTRRREVSLCETCSATRVAESDDSYEIVGRLIPPEHRRILEMKVERRTLAEIGDELGHDGNWVHRRWLRIQRLAGKFFEAPPDPSGRYDDLILSYYVRRRNPHYRLARALASDPDEWHRQGATVSPDESEHDAGELDIWYAKLLYESDRPNLAIQHLGRVERLEEFRDEARYHIGIAWRRKRDLQRAWTFIGPLCESRGTRGLRARHQLGIIQELDGDLKGAERSFLKVEKEWRDRRSILGASHALYRLGRVRSKLGGLRNYDALEALLEALQNYRSLRASRYVKQTLAAIRQVSH